MTGPARSEALYLYGFAPASASPPGLAGIADAPVELLAAADIAAVVARVPATEFGEGALEGRMKDVRWVAEQGVLHERVVAWFVDHAEILPARLFTLYSSERALRAAIEGRLAEIGGRLRRFAALREWELRVSRREDRIAERLAALSPGIEALDREIARAAPGRKFLLERKRADLARSEAAAAARRLAAGLLDEIAAMAEDTRRLPVSAPVAGAPPTDSLPVILAASLLVRADAQERIVQHVRARSGELQDHGVDVRFSGPWAPYRFVGDDDGTAGAARDG